MEDFIFDDDVDEVGAEVEAHCPKCKADTTHVVISKYEDEIRKVQCNPCGDVHAYRKPRGESVEDEAEPTPKKKAPKAKPTWDQIMAKSKKPPRPYALSDYFKELEIVSHPKFGVGYVTENIGADKIEVTFKEDKRVLVHNRKGLVLPISMMTARVETVPAPVGKGKAGKGKAALVKTDADAKSAMAGSGKAPVKAVVAPIVKAAPAPAAKGKSTVVAKSVPAKPAAAKTAPAKATVKSAGKSAGKATVRPLSKKPVKSAAAPKGKVKAAAKPQSKAKPAARAVGKVAAKRR